MTKPTARRGLSEIVSGMTLIYINSLELCLYTEYLHNPDTADEVALLEKSAHRSNLSFIRHTLYRTLVVELSKLFSKSPNDGYSLYQTIIPGSHFADIIDSMTMEDLRGKWQLLSSTIDELLIMRNKFYAHTDFKKDMYKSIELDFDKILQLVNLSEHFVIQLTRIFHKADFIPIPPTFDRQRFLLLELLSKAEKDRLAEIKKKYRNLRPYGDNGT